LWVTRISSPAPTSPLTMIRRYVPVRSASVTRRGNKRSCILTLSRQQGTRARIPQVPCSRSPTALRPAHRSRRCLRWLSFPQTDRMEATGRVSLPTNAGPRPRKRRGLYRTHRGLHDPPAEDRFAARSNACSRISDKVAHHARIGRVWPAPSHAPTAISAATATNDRARRLSEGLRAILV
jgi:hypothetical protein